MSQQTDQEDADVEAWSIVVRDLLNLAPSDKRMRVLELAGKQEAAKQERRESQPFEIYQPNEDWKNSPAIRHRHCIMNIKSMAVCEFVRDIVNDNSPTDAAKILFKDHRGRVSGSGWLPDYLDRVCSVPLKELGLDEWK